MTPAPRLALALLLLTISSSTWAPAVVGGTLQGFGEATAVSTFGESIRVEQTAILRDAPVRAEAVVRAAGSNRTFLTEIPTPAAGETTLRYTYATPFGSLYPNTRVELGFRLTFADGTVLDGPTTSIVYADDRFAWKTIEGPLVRVHWTDGDEAFGRRALAIGERAIEEATDLLGVDETRPIDFFVYADRDAFYDVLGPAIQEGVGGVALAEIRTLFANIEPSQVNDAWVGVVIPHELTHLVFDTATRNPYHEPPHWLNEGLADYLAQGYNAGARAAVENAARSGAIMPLRALVGQFPAQQDRFSLAYDESVSAIDFLIRTYGQDALVGLIRSYADGVSDDVAFEAGWLQDVGFPAPKPLGPQLAPVGPLPPGWNGTPVGTPGPGTSAGPVATAGPGTPVDSGGNTGVLVYVGLGVLGFLIVAGLVVVASRMSRGQPFLPPLAPEPPSVTELPEAATPAAPPPAPVTPPPADEP